MVLAEARGTLYGVLSHFNEIVVGKIKCCDIEIAIVPANLCLGIKLNVGHVAEYICFPRFLFVCKVPVKNMRGGN